MMAMTCLVGSMMLCVSKCSPDSWRMTAQLKSDSGMRMKRVVPSVTSQTASEPFIFCCSQWVGLRNSRYSVKPPRMPFMNGCA